MPYRASARAATISWPVFVSAAATGIFSSIARLGVDRLSASRRAHQFQ